MSLFRLSNFKLLLKVKKYKIFSKMKPHCCTVAPYKPVTHVIFDMDGTILDTEGIYHSAISSIAAEYGKIYTTEMKNKVAGSIEQDTAKIAVKEMQLPITWEEFLDVFHEKSNSLLPDADFMPGIEKMIKHLHAKGIPIAIATSSAQEASDLKTKKHKDIFDLFHHIVCGSSDPEVKHGKPSPDIFLVCASRFPNKPHPSECLVFEDAPNGVKGALSAGMQVVMIPDKQVPYDMWKIATLRLDSMENMIPELFGLPAFGDDDQGNLPDEI